MGRNPKYSAEEKINVINEYLDEKESMSSIARHLDIALLSFRQWVKNYEAMETAAFLPHQSKHYSKSKKELAVAIYLAGEGSHMDICKKYKILSTRQLRSFKKLN